MRLRRTLVGALLGPILKHWTSTNPGPQPEARPAFDLHPVLGRFEGLSTEKQELGNC
jgi:hypothetical protein